MAAPATAAFVSVPAPAPEEEGRLKQGEMDTTDYQALPGAPPKAPPTTITTLTADLEQPIAEQQTTAEPAAANDDAAAGLPTAWQLWKFIYKDVLFGNPLLRDLVWLDLALHLLVWSAFTVLLWGFFLGYLPFTIKSKVMYFSLLGAFAIFMDIWGILINAALLGRLRDRTKFHSLRTAFSMTISTHRCQSLWSLASALTGVRMIYIAGNNIIPFVGIFVLPVIIKKCTLRRYGVAWGEQMDMSIPMLINDRCGYPTARHKAIAYYLKRWGPSPIPTVDMNKVIFPPILFVLFFVIVPMLVVGGRMKNKELMAAGFTLSIVVFAFIQFMRPLAVHIYCHAAIRWTEHGENEIFAPWPAVAPKAFKCGLTKKEKKVVEEARAEEMAEDGWVEVKEPLSMVGEGGGEGEGKKGGEGEGEVQEGLMTTIRIENEDGEAADGGKK